MGIEDILFPKKCYGCGSGGFYLCNECALKINEAQQICPECERPSIGGWVHPRCKKKQGMERLKIFTKYEGAVKQMLKDVKFRSSWRVMQELSEKLVRSGERLDVGDRKFVVCSVPMWRIKQKSRGFNQAEILAREIADYEEIEYKEYLVRVRETKSQYGLSARERKENLRGAIEMQGDNVNNIVLLVDDIWTSGATMKECVKVLKRKGASEVWGVVASR